MKRSVSAAVVGLVSLLLLAGAAMAAVSPGTYRGNLYSGTTKVSTASVTVTGNKVTIKAAKLPIKCQGPQGEYDVASEPTRYEFKGTIKGNAVSGNYYPPLGGSGEAFTAKGTFASTTKSFSGKVGFIGRCRGTATIRAKKG